jgi:hypothetical protein
MADFRPAPGVRLFIIDDEAIVYAHAAQKLYTFNTAATFIWCGLELGDSAAKVARSLSETAGIALDDAKQRIADARRHWRALGLLEGRRRKPLRLPRRRQAKPRRPAVSTLPAHARARFIGHATYALLGSAVRVRFTSADQRDFVHPVLAHLDHGRARPSSTVELIGLDGVHHICQDGAVAHTGLRVDELAPIVKWLVWEEAVNNHSFFLNIHAGVVGDGKSLTLLPAAAGSGKSSLTAALSGAGFDYFSDEIALLEEPDLAVRPSQIAVCIKSTGWDVMASYFPEVRTLKSHHRSDGKIVRYMPPPPFTNGSRLDRTYPVARIIFPHYRPDHRTALVPIKRVEALRRLMDECASVPVPLTARRIARLVRWIKQIACYELPLSSLDEAVTLVRASLGRGAGSVTKSLQRRVSQHTDVPSRG